MNCPTNANAASRKEDTDGNENKELRLDQAKHIRRELAQMYYDGKFGRRDVQECQRLAQILKTMSDVNKDAAYEREIDAIRAELEQLRANFAAATSGIPARNLGAAESRLAN